MVLEIIICTCYSFFNGLTWNWFNINALQHTTPPVKWNVNIFRKNYLSLYNEICSECVLYLVGERLVEYTCVSYNRGNLTHNSRKESARARQRRRQNKTTVFRRICKATAVCSGCAAVAGECSCANALIGSTLNVGKLGQDKMEMWNGTNHWRLSSYLTFYLSSCCWCCCRAGSRGSSNSCSSFITFSVSPEIRQPSLGNNGTMRLLLWWCILLLSDNSIKNAKWSKYQQYY